MPAVIVTPEPGQTLDLPNATFNRLAKDAQIWVSPSGYATFGRGYAAPADPVRLTTAEYTLARMMCDADRAEARAREKFDRRMREAGYFQQTDPNYYYAERQKDPEYRAAGAASCALWDYARLTLAPARLYHLAKYTEDLFKDSGF